MEKMHYDRQGYEDEIAASYGLHTPDKNGTEGNMYEKIEKELPDLRGKVILDAGCGQCRWAPLFMERGASKIIGVDSSKEQLDRIPEEIRNKMTVIHGGLQDKLPEFGPNADIGWACFSVCCFPDPAEPIEAIHRSLKPNGKMIVATNVFVPAELAKKVTRHDESMQIQIRDYKAHEGSPVLGRYFRHVLEDGNVPLQDCGHGLPEYERALRNWADVNVKMMRPQGIKYIDAQDTEANIRFYGAPADEKVISAQKEGLEYMKLCITATKK